MAGSKRDYYEVLGVSKNATPDEIRNAYRQLTKKWHPDRNPKNKKEAEEKFKEITEAYEVLSDPQKKAKYDRFGFAGDNAMDFNFGDSNFDIGDIFGHGVGDIFDMFFGGGGRAAQQRSAQRTSARPGEDINVVIQLSFKEAVHGTMKDVSYTKFEVCDACHGAGGTGKRTCPKCGGSGRVRSVRRTMFTNLITETTCDMCGGKGYTYEHVCSVCHGTGRVPKKKTIPIKIPVGVENGARMRFSGYGNVGYNGGPSGDLYVTFKVNPDPKFTRKGNDIITMENISFVQAALGAEIEVETIHGFEKLKIHPGTQSGQKYILKGKGVLGRKKGNHIIVVNVQIPKKLSRAQKKLLKEYAEISNINVN
jgi:molecular chaperone DnaJ